MLVLTRREKDIVIITMPDNRQIIVAVVQIKDNTTRIGFQCDTDIKIERVERNKPKKRKLG